MGGLQRADRAVSRHDRHFRTQSHQPERVLRLVGLLESERPKLCIEEWLANVGALLDGAARHWRSLTQASAEANQTHRSRLACPGGDGSVTERALLAVETWFAAA